MDAIDSMHIKCIESSHIPNQETRKVLEAVAQGKNLIKDKEAAKICKKKGFKCLSQLIKPNLLRMLSE